MAVEQVAGMYINSNTVVSNTAVELDEILSHAQGYVQNIQVISESVNGGEYRIRANVDVNTDPNSAFMKRMDAVMRMGDPRIGVVILSATTTADSPGMTRSSRPPSTSACSTLVSSTSSM